MAIDPRYPIVAAAFVIQSIVIGGLFAYGVFFEVLEDELGWSRTLLSACTSLAVFIMGTLAIVAGRLSDRIGPRWVLNVSSVCFGLGYMLMFYMDSPWHLLVLCGLLIGIGLSTHDVVTLSIVAHWFERRRGMMTGVVKVGTAVGQITIPLFAAWLIATYGWRIASVVLGAVATVVLLIATQGLRRKLPGADTSTSTQAASNKHSATAGVTLRTAARTRQFWTLCVSQLLFFPSLITIPVHIVAHGTDLGLETTRAAALLSTIGAASIVGRLAIGGAIDRIGGKRGFLASYVGLIASLLLLCTVSSAWPLFVFAVVYGVAHGGFFTVVSPTVAEFFGMRAHGAIFGVVLFFGTIGGALGPTIAGAVFDRTGSYDFAFWGLAAFACVGLLLVTSLQPLSLRDDGHRNS